MATGADIPSRRPAAHPPRAPRGRVRAARARGFTLIEILVIVVIIGILTTGFLLSINLNGSADPDLDKEGQRITALVNLAREQAELQTREYGLLCREDTYEFVSFDVRRNQWRSITEDEELRPRRLPVGLDLKLVIEGRPVVLSHPRKDRDKDDAASQQPQVMIFSNGDLTAFELTVERDSGAHSVTITQDDKGQVVVKPMKGQGQGRART